MAIYDLYISHNIITFCIITYGTCIWHRIWKPILLYPPQASNLSAPNFIATNKCIFTPFLKNNPMVFSSIVSKCSLVTIKNSPWMAAFVICHWMNQVCCSLLLQKCKCDHSIFTMYIYLHLEYIMMIFLYWIYCIIYFTFQM